MEYYLCLLKGLVLLLLEWVYDLKDLPQAASIVNQTASSQCRCLVLFYMLVNYGILKHNGFSKNVPSPTLSPLKLLPLNYATANMTSSG